MSGSLLADAQTDVLALVAIAGFVWVAWLAIVMRPRP